MRTPRQALREIRDRLRYLYGRMDGSFDQPALKEVCEIAEEGLAYPAMNCEVGSLDAQKARWMRFCSRHRGCKHCGLVYSDRQTCLNAWRLMDFTESERHE